MEICETQIWFRSLFLLLEWVFFPRIVSEKQLLKIRGNSAVVCLNPIISDSEDEKYSWFKKKNSTRNTFQTPSN